jgi:hypothetical protein
MAQDALGLVILGAFALGVVCIALMLLGALVSLTFLIWQQVWEQWRERR